MNQEPGRVSRTDGLLQSSIPVVKTRNDPAPQMTATNKIVSRLEPIARPDSSRRTGEFLGCRASLSGSFTRSRIMHVDNSRIISFTFASRKDRQHAAQASFSQDRRLTTGYTVRCRFTDL